jgi:hypothetical protein
MIGNYIFFLWRNSQNLSSAAPFFMFLNHTKTHTHTPGRTPLKKRSACRRGRYLHNTQLTQQTKIYAFIEIRTLNSSNQAFTDLHLRQCGHRNRQLWIRKATAWSGPGIFEGFVTEIAWRNKEVRRGTSVSNVGVPTTNCTVKPGVVPQTCHTAIISIILHWH